VLGKRLGRFSRLNVGYNFESVTSTTFLNTIDDPTRIEQEFNVSSIVPVFSFSTVDNPYRPSRGRALTASMQISGGPLGGDTALLKPILTYTHYRPLNRKLHAAFHAQTGWVGDWDDGTTGQTSLIGGVPRFQRFWLGGDTQGPRVFETRSVTPLRYVEVDDNGQIVAILSDPRFISIDDVITSGGQPATIEVGGNRFYLLQSELVVPFNEQAEIAFFVDAGDSLYDDQSWSFDTTRVSAGVELRFHLPIFPVPLRLIYGFPVRDLQGDDTSAFTFSIGKSF
jgi:outer membrane protein assembly factor BamA